jgi:hypothetical protein
MPHLVRGGFGEKRRWIDDPRLAGVVADCAARLRRVVDPEAADLPAYPDQAARVAALRGGEAVLARGICGYSPVPGTKAVGAETEQPANR